MKCKYCKSENVTIISKSIISPYYDKLTFYCKKCDMDWTEVIDND